MATVTTLAVTYVLGGLTFLPLAALLFFIHAFVFLPRPAPQRHNVQLDSIASDEGSPEVDAKLLDRGLDPDVAAGYFAVCREYVPGGVNGKPPERTTPAGETIAAESPSVYQSMYRSIFERNKTQGPSLEGGKAVKKARNVFYVVLRHAHLLLFDNSEQLEVRHVIALIHYDLDLYAGGDTIPEGELYIKRNCIRLTKKKTPGEERSQTMPFYLFSDNCSEKEDFYHALVHSQTGAMDRSDDSPTTQMFDTEDMIKLVRALHVSDENQSTRWLNALLGRLFLALYKTNEIEALLRIKIEKKIARVPKPTFLTSLTLENVHMGNSAPTVINPKLREMTVDGGLTLEADIKYNGGFKVVIAAVARIELGTRFKPRTVNLVLASIFKRLEGHLLIHIKPPPSNRIWISFETMPKLDVSVEPIVSSRQITYSIVLRAIESRIREVVGETIVYPNWDDIPFFDTELQSCRGGIWKRKAVPETPTIADISIGDEFSSEVIDDELLSDAISPSITTSSSKAKRNSMQATTSRTSSRSSTIAASKNEHSHTQMDHSNSSQTSMSTPPKILRSNSFAAIATPVVTKDDQFIGETNRHRPKQTQQDATSAMKELSSRAQDSSSASSSNESASRSSTPPVSLLSPLDPPDSADQKDISGSAAQISQDNNNDIRTSTDTGPSSRLDVPLGHNSAEPFFGRSNYTPNSKFITADKKAVINQSIGSATAAAKKWGMGVLNRQAEWKKQASAIATKDNVREPYGRGQPLPPPGMPLPRPESNSWSATALNSLKRKPMTTTLRPASLVSVASGESGSIQAEEGSTSSLSEPIEPERTESLEPLITTDVEDASAAGVMYEDEAFDRSPVDLNASIGNESKESALEEFAKEEVLQPDESKTPRL